MENEEFNEKILDCIDRGLDVFGPKIKNFIYWHYTQMSELSRYSLISSFREFSKVLEELFGKGAKSIENNIVREIILEFSLEATETETFADVLVKAREKANLIQEAPSF